MRPKETRPENSFYENPYMPNEVEKSELIKLPLRGVEAHTILVNRIGVLSDAEKKQLQNFIDKDLHPDQEFDLYSISEKLTLDGGYHDE